MRPRVGPARVLVVLALAGCGGGASTTSARPTAPATATPRASAGPTAIPVTLRGRSGKRKIEFSEQKGNRLAFKLFADDQTADRAPSGDATSIFTNPVVTFYPPDGKALVAVAPTGKVAQQAKTVEVLMSGRVRAHTTDGTTLESDTLRYDDGDQTIHARGDVVLTTKDERLTGGALDADLRLSHVHLTPGDS